MKFQCATIAAPTHTFAVVIVPKPILNDQHRAAQTIAFFQMQWFHLPIVLMARDERGVPSSYYGRADLAVILSRIPSTGVPWQELDIA